MIRIINRNGETFLITGFITISLLLRYTVAFIMCPKPRTSRLS